MTSILFLKEENDTKFAVTTNVFLTLDETFSMTPVDTAEREITYMHLVALSSNIFLLKMP